MTDATTSFERHGWTVELDLTPDDPDEPVWQILDTDGDLYDEYNSLEDAIAVCSERGLADYRERLWDAIQEADPDDFLTIGLERVARELNIDISEV